MLHLQPLESGLGASPLPDLLEIVGKCGRVAQVIPEARPYSHTMWAAYTGAAKADSDGLREAKPNHGAHRRFALAARWFRKLIRPSGPDVLFALRSYVPAVSRPVPTVNGLVLQFDASP